MTLGDIENKPFLWSRMAHKVADNVSLAAGSLVYQDTTLGLKVVPTTSQPIAPRIRFLEKAADNTITGHAYGLIVAETYKQGALVVGKMDLTATPGSFVRASTNVAGAFMALAVPADLTGGDAPTEAEHISVLEFLRRNLGIYRGHIGEGKSVSGAQPTDAADTETNIQVEMT